MRSPHPPGARPAATSTERGAHDRRDRVGGPSRCGVGDPGRRRRRRRASPVPALEWRTVAGIDPALGLVRVRGVGRTPRRRGASGGGRRRSGARVPARARARAARRDRRHAHDGDGVRQGAPAVRSADRRVPGGEAPPGRRVRGPPGGRRGRRGELAVRPGVHDAGGEGAGRHAPARWRRSTACRCWARSASPSSTTCTASSAGCACSTASTAPTASCALALGRLLQARGRVPRPGARLSVARAQT